MSSERRVAAQLAAPPIRAYLLAAQLAPRLPRRLGHWLAERVGDYLFSHRPEAREAVLENLSYVLPHASAGERHRTARGVFRTQLQNYFDLFNLPRLTLDQVRRVVRADGLERLTAFLRPDRGAIVAGPHLGNIDVVAQLAVARGLQATMGVEALHPPELHALVSGLRASQGIQILSLDTAGLKGLLRALEGPRVVGMAADRDTTGSGRWLTFFGHRARLPVGYVALALRTGAPLFMAFAERRPGQRYEIEMVGPLPLVQTRDREEALDINLHQPLRLMEDRIRRRPEQWVMFERVWSPTGQRPAEALC